MLVVSGRILCLFGDHDKVLGFKHSGDRDEAKVGRLDEVDGNDLSHKRRDDHIRPETDQWK